MKDNPSACAGGKVGSAPNSPKVQPLKPQAQRAPGSKVERSLSDTVLHQAAHSPGVLGSQWALQNWAALAPFLANSSLHPGVSAQSPPLVAAASPLMQHANELVKPENGTVPPSLGQLAGGVGAGIQPQPQAVLQAHLTQFLYNNIMNSLRTSGAMQMMFTPAGSNLDMGSNVQVDIVDPLPVPGAKVVIKPSVSPTKKRKATKNQTKASGSPKKDRQTNRESLTSQYRGVSQHRLTGRWEASIWSHKRQVYLGGFDEEEKAARAYDTAAIKCKGKDARLNLGLESYGSEEVEKIEAMSFEDLVAKLRRESSAFSRGKSRYRGVSGHKAATNFQRPWEARIGRFFGKKNVFLGLFESEEEAARQYDRALIISKGLNAKTNFDVRDYQKEALETKKCDKKSILKEKGIKDFPSSEADTTCVGRYRPMKATADNGSQSTQSTSTDDSNGNTKRETVARNGNTMIKTVPNLKEMLSEMILSGSLDDETQT